MASSYLLLNYSNVVSCVKYRMGIQYFWLLRQFWIPASRRNDGHLYAIT